MSLSKFNKLRTAQLMKDRTKDRMKEFQIKYNILQK